MLKIVRARVQGKRYRPVRVEVHARDTSHRPSILLESDNSYWEWLDSWADSVISWLRSARGPPLLADALSWASVRPRVIAAPSTLPIRSVAWHHMQDRLALALGNDQVCVFYPDGLGT